MTLLARRRDELAREPGGPEVVGEKRRVVVRPRPPKRGYLHAHAAVGNRATEAFLRAEAVNASRRGEPVPLGRPIDRLGRGGLSDPRLAPALQMARALRSPPAPPGSAPTTKAARSPLGLLVPDGATPAPGQMTRGAFLSAMHGAARAAAEEGLTGSGQTARGCPWIRLYFRFYGRQSAQRIEADLLRYVPAAAHAGTAHQLLALATDHVRASVAHWTATGELTGVPRGLPGRGLLGALAGSLAGVGGVVARSRSGAPPAASANERRGGLAQAEKPLAGAEGRATAGESGGPAALSNGDSPAAVLGQLGPGQPLDGSARRRMEGALGTGFGSVRLHTDPGAARLARRLRAPAFAVGRHVAFDRGEYRPGTIVGDAMLAHELAHVAQQRGTGRDSPGAGGGARALERDADGAAAGAVARLWGRGRTRGMRLPGPQHPRLRAGLSLRRCTPNSDQWFLPYRDRFSQLWNEEPYSSLPTAYDPALSSKGPRTRRSRAIFERLYLEDAELREAYDENKGGLRERIDTYTGPEGLNLIDSPRLRALEQVFARFDPPVSGDTYERFKQAVATAAGNLDEDDRRAITLSNEWQRQINRYVREADHRREIRRLINPPVAPGEAPPPGSPEEELTQEQKVRRFFDRWRAHLQFKRGLNEPYFSSSSDVRYEDDGQLFRVSSSSSIANPGQVLYVRVRVRRGSAVVASPDPQRFPAGRRRMPPIVIPVRAPSPIPDEGDQLVVEVELLESDLTTVRGSRRFEVTLREQASLTQAAVEAIAAEDDGFLNDTSSTGLLGKMRAEGGIPGNVDQAIRLGSITLRALTERHDSGEYVERSEGRPDPSKIGYFAGPVYGANDSQSFVAVPADAFRLSRFGPRFIAVNRTADLRNPSRKRPDNALIRICVHEAVHAYDVREDSNTPLERYKTEFRAYWMDGRYGPPLEGSCPEGEAPERCTDLRRRCLDTNYCAELPAPGPKTPRSRRIFNHLYGSTTYRFVKENYDENVDGFRQAVDQYVIPDGINLIASVWLEQLRGVIDLWNGSNFEAFRERVLYWTAPAPRGRLNDMERAQVRGGRAWRDLVERKVRDSDQQRQIKQDMGIPS